MYISVGSIVCNLQQDLNYVIAALEDGFVKTYWLCIHSRPMSRLTQLWQNYAKRFYHDSMRYMIQCKHFATALWNGPTTPHRHALVLRVWAEDVINGLKLLHHNTLYKSKGFQVRRWYRGGFVIQICKIPKLCEWIDGAVCVNLVRSELPSQ